MNVAQVKALGNKVEIVHLRNAHPSCPEVGPFRRFELEAMHCRPYNLGGITEVYVTTPTGQVLRGVARCSNRDNFNKKLGVQIALGRAMTSGE